MNENGLLMYSNATFAAEAEKVFDLLIVSWRVNWRLGKAKHINKRHTKAFGKIVDFMI
jgi:hypothetical protein